MADLDLETVERSTGLMKRGHASRISSFRYLSVIILFFAHDLRKFYGPYTRFVSRTKRERERERVEDIGSCADGASARSACDRRAALRDSCTLFDLEDFGESRGRTRVHPERVRGQPRS